jgi:hypothetical protein
VFACGILGELPIKTFVRQRYDFMRWKLLGLVSVIGALFSVTLWSALTIATFGSASSLARNGWIALGSLVIPLGISIFGGLFVYRHTAHRRKTQAALAALLTLLLTAAIFLVASTLTPRLHIASTTEERPVR